MSETIIRTPTFSDPSKTPYLNLHFTFSPSETDPTEWGTAERSFNLYRSQTENLDPSEIPNDLDETIVGIVHDLAMLSDLRAWQAEKSLSDGKSIDLWTDMQETLKFGSDLVIARAGAAGLGSWSLKSSTTCPSGDPPRVAWIGIKDDVKGSFRELRETTGNFSILSEIHESKRQDRAGQNASKLVPRLSIALTTTPNDEQKASSSPLAKEVAETGIGELLADHLKVQNEEEPGC